MLAVIKSLEGFLLQFQIMYYKCYQFCIIRVEAQSIIKIYIDDRLEAYFYIDCFKDRGEAKIISDLQKGVKSLRVWLFQIMIPSWNASVDYFYY